MLLWWMTRQPEVELFSVKLTINARLVQLNSREPEVLSLEAMSRGRHAGRSLPAGLGASTNALVARRAVGHHPYRENKCFRRLQQTTSVKNDAHGAQTRHLIESKGMVVGGVESTRCPWVPKGKTVGLDSKWTPGRSLGGGLGL